MLGVAGNQAAAGVAAAAAAEEASSEACSWVWQPSAVLPVAAHLRAAWWRDFGLGSGLQPWSVQGSCSNTCALSKSVH